VCGVYGMVSLDGAPLRHAELAPECARAIRHRGPDSHGELSLPHVHIATERLRIIDLESRADQPFADPSGRVFLVCNGEIYNFAELRRRYPDYPYRSHSDVEVILPLYLDRGADAIAELNGMFGLAIWDERSRTLTLARDRAGEKPLFFAEGAGELWFASEIPALLAMPGLSRALDRDALEEYLTLGYVLEPRTLFAAVRQVGAGTVMQLHAGGRRARRYWDVGEVGERPVSDRAAADELDAQLQRAVAAQMVADVPVGVCLSGGLDSSLLTALAMRERGGAGLLTFSISFGGGSYDEGEYARRVAALIGTDHTDVPVGEAELAAAFRTIAEKVADVVADPAILPTYLLAKAAREKVTVLLSGEGADELFGGYPTYVGHVLMRGYQALPGIARRALRRRVEGIRPSDQAVPLEFLLKRFVAGDGKRWDERHTAWVSTGLPDLLGRPVAALPAAGGEGRSVLAGAMLLDYHRYLRDDLLVKLDRAGMLTSLETRVPYLDREVTTFACSLPDRLRVRWLTTKWLLKRVGERYLPRGIVHRRKHGLSVPVGAWMNGTLRGEVDRLLEPTRLRAQGLLPPAAVARLLAEHREGRANHARALWPLVVLEAWVDRWRPDLGAAGEPPGRG
jgi:asparagine synthase (glutamine-hydrolysing)